MIRPFSKISGITVYKEEPMVKHTSFRIGGKARYFIRVHSVKSLKRTLQAIKQYRLQYTVIGAGTNILTMDRGFDGVVLKLDGVFKIIKKTDSMFTCGAAVMIDTFLRHAVETSCSGAEFLAGIPGTIGGGIKGNAGAFGKSFETITSGITVLSKRLELVELVRGDIGFRYRSTNLANSDIITQARIHLVKGSRKLIMQEIKRNKEFRWQRQPTEYSAGSFFKNPKPHTAGALIESCGLKGTCVGDAEVSLKHANFIINRGKATASDVLQLARRIQRTVRRITGIKLEMEVRVLK